MCPRDQGGAGHQDAILNNPEHQLTLSVTMRNVFKRLNSKIVKMSDKNQSSCLETHYQELQVAKILSAQEVRNQAKRKRTKKLEENI